MAFETDLDTFFNVDEFAITATIQPFPSGASFSQVGVLDDEALWGDEYTGEVNTDVSRFSFNGASGTSINKRDTLTAENGQVFEVIAVIPDPDGLWSLALKQTPNQTNSR